MRSAQANRRPVQCCGSSGSSPTPSAHASRAWMSDRRTGVSFHPAPIGPGFEGRGSGSAAVAARANTSSSRLACHRESSCRRAKRKRTIRESLGLLSGWGQMSRGRAGIRDRSGHGPAREGGFSCLDPFGAGASARRPCSCCSPCWPQPDWWSAARRPRARPRRRGRKIACAMSCSRFTAAPGPSAGRI